MAITIELTEAHERLLSEKAARVGMTVQALVFERIRPDVSPKRANTFDEIAAPISAAFARTGCTEEDLDAAIETARQEIWDEQNPMPPTPRSS